MAEGSPDTLEEVQAGTPADLFSATEAMRSIGALEFSPPPLRAIFPRNHEIHASTRVIGGVSKRAFDIVVASSALLALAPVLIGVWALVRVDSPGPGLFKQRRGGFEGRPFRILKFRTMRLCESRAITQAKPTDDRTTLLGRTLRKYSIDELPQLINVLKGDMSIIGPRPHALAHDRQFYAVDRRYALRHRARPGMTGLAQVSGSRGSTETKEKIVQRLEFDLTYVSSWSWKMDTAIFLRTLRVLWSDHSAF